MLTKRVFSAAHETSDHETSFFGLLTKRVLTKRVLTKRVFLAAHETSAHETSAHEASFFGCSRNECSRSEFEVREQMQAVGSIYHSMKKNRHFANFCVKIICTPTGECTGLVKTSGTFILMVSSHFHFPYGESRFKYFSICVYIWRTFFL